jgi:hypothetical protein
MSFIRVTIDKNDNIEATKGGEKLGVKAVKHSIGSIKHEIYLELKDED